MTLSYIVIHLFYAYLPAVTVSLPTPLLVMLDAIADERHMNRSELVRDILRQYLEKDESNFQRY